MGRTRSALLHATAECITRYGVRKTTMVDVASKSGVAKATLYNHFRTKGDVLAGLVEQQVADLVAACTAVAASDGLVAALTLVGESLAGSAPLRKAAQGEQALVAPLTTPGQARGWQVARDGVTAILEAARVPHGPAEVELLLRWCASQVLWPLAPVALQEAAQVLARGLDGQQVAATPPPTSSGSAPAEVDDGRSVTSAPALVGVGAPVSGLGWPS